MRTIQMQMGHQKKIKKSQKHKKNMKKLEK